MEQARIDSIGLTDSALSATEQMAFDERLALEAQPTVRVFTWNSPAISLGFKQAPPAWLEEARWRDAELELVERPTGGGIAFHGSDVSISVVAPRRAGVSPHALVSAACDSATRLCRAYGLEATTELVSGQTSRVTYCLTQSSPYAVFVCGRKAGGFALRRFPDSWLVQGSLLVRPLPAVLAEALPRGVRAALEERAVSLSEASGKWVDEADAAQRWLAEWVGGMMRCETCQKDVPTVMRVVAAKGYNRSLARPLYNCRECFEKKEKTKPYAQISRKTREPTQNRQDEMHEHVQSEFRLGEFER